MGLRELLSEELLVLAKCTLSFNINKEIIESILDHYFEALRGMVDEEKYYRKFFERCRERFDRFPSYAEIKRFLNEDKNRMLRKENYE